MQFINLETNNVNTTFIKTNKFKTITIQVVFLGEFNQENATKRSLLARMLPLSTKKYPTKKAIYNRLHDLYDMSIGVATYPLYTTNMTTFNIEYVNPKFLKNEENLHIEAIDLLKELIYNPNITNGGFDSKLFKEQKNILKQNILNIYNNKNRYALRQLLNNMGKDEIISVSVLGNLNDLELVNEKNLYELHQQIIKEEKAYIFVIGNFDNDEMEENLKLLGNFNNQDKEFLIVSNEERKISEVKEFVEKQNVNQAQLMMGFRTNINTADPDYPAALVFNAMFGGTFQSDLIRVVREENSLAYTIASQMIADLKLLFVSAGIDSEQYKLAKDLVVKELDNYKAGNISEENLKLAKDNLINELIEIEDIPTATISFYFRNKLTKQNVEVEDFIEKVKLVNLEDVKNVALGINLDTIFLLASEDYNG